MGDYASSMDLRRMRMLYTPSQVPAGFDPGDYRDSYEFQRLLHGYEPEHASIFKAPDNHTTINAFRRKMASYVKKYPRKSRRNSKDIQDIQKRNLSIRKQDVLKKVLPLQNKQPLQIKQPLQNKPITFPKKQTQLQPQNQKQTQPNPPDSQFARYIDNSRIVQNAPLRFDTDLLLQYLTKIPNAGGGDCFFYSVAQANIPKNIIDQIADPRIRTIFGNGNGPITMQQLRNVVAELVNVSVFMDYNEQQVQLYVAEQNPNYNVTKRGTFYMKSIYTVHELQQRNPIIEKIKLLMQVQQNQQDNFAITRLIKTMMPVEEARTKLDLFKQYVRSSNYWADMMTVNLMRELLNIQFIIFDSNEHQITNIIKFDDKCMFAGYIIIWWTSPVHYELLKYKGTGFFTFETLPPLIKYLVNANVVNCPQCNDDAHFPIAIAQVPHPLAAGTGPTEHKSPIDVKSLGKRIRKNKVRKSI